MNRSKREYAFDRVVNFMQAQLAKTGRAPTVEEVEAHLIRKRLATREVAAQLARLYGQHAEMMAGYHQKIVPIVRRIRRRRKGGAS